MFNDASVSQHSLESLKTLAVATAQAAGELLLHGATKEINSETDDDVKMQADVDSENLVREKLKSS
ncbi:MAG: hypothetical protein EBQ49_05595, partial [Verrucomicrobia bacterium]|nr:hypothetical protein [Verrucomicrobiota bacterium]